MPTTSRFALRYPGASDSPDVPTDLAELAADVDAAIGKMPVAAKTANYTLTDTDGLILAATAGGAFTLTIPAASSHTGRRFRIKKTDSSTNALTIARTGSDTLEGSTGFALRSQYAEVDLVSDGTNWHVLDYHPGMAATVLPASAFDGQTVNYLADATNGVVWELMYRSAEATYKWLYVGGPRLVAEVAASQGTAATHSAYQDLATAGPSVIAPLAGDYNIELNAGNASNANANENCRMAAKIGAAASSDNDSSMSSGVDADSLSAFLPQRNVSAAATTIKAQYRSGAGSQATFAARRLAVTPIRVA